MIEGLALRLCFGHRDGWGLGEIGRPWAKLLLGLPRSAVPQETPQLPLECGLAHHDDPFAGYWGRRISWTYMATIMKLVPVNRKS